MNNFSNSRIVFIGVIFSILAVMLAGCNINPNNTGSITLSLFVAENRTIEANIDMTAASYTLSGQGPQGKYFEESSITSDMTIADLCVGTWFITIFALNANGDRIYTGQTSADVLPNARVPVDVTLTPLSGNGTLNIGVTWDEGTEVSLIGELIPFSGPAYTSLFPGLMSYGSAAYRNTELAAGYYTLIVKVDVDGKIYGGNAEIIRIVSGAETDARFQFDLSGSSTFNININPDNPLDISLSGFVAGLVLNETMSLTASVPQETGNVSFVWYLDGVVIGTDAAIEVTGTIAGDHVLSLTGFTADGLRGGAVSRTFNVSYQPVTIKHTIMALTSPNGSITPFDAIIVERGRDQSFTVESLPSYRINSIVIDHNLPVAGVAGLKKYTYTFTNVTTDHTIQAFFEHAEHNLTVQASGSGKTDLTGTALYESDVPIAIAAAADTEWITFTGWTVVSGDAVIADPTSLATTVTLNDKNSVIQANFVHEAYTITWYSMSTTGIKTTNQKSVKRGESITITTASGYKTGTVLYTFNYWNVTSGSANVIIADKYGYRTTVQLIGHAGATITPVYKKQ